ncbi:pyruvate formate-lyase 1-activating enzyme [Fibrobacter sp. UWB1]|uniref:pyruvate formate-lyase-activating protein n=1 Tax=Fibrobacter sp. UWB1 TaxID=1964355 RepID=UPI000B5246C8|nr:pyruvate formate-lyase-activating protein [Fibrobacter sp. UWB1]OWV25147.1 pyruvate formate-lyase 1-activating enzyme [Fibrobacter sp. UWB1]
MLGRINKLETFGSVDGPGVRFVVFVQGCPMRCQFCHNPETWDFKGDKAGAYDISAQDLLKKALRYQSYWGKDGGITVSGGEPLAQMDFLIEFFEAAKAAGVHTCIDTSGVNFVRNEPYFGKFKRLMDATDLLLVDIKNIDPTEHKKLTGHDNKNILDMFRYLDEIQKPIWIRHVLVPGMSDNDELLIKTREFIDTLHNVEKIEVLPYHALALAKYQELGIDYVLKDVKSPSAERVANAKKILGILP